MPETDGTHDGTADGFDPEGADEIVEAWLGALPAPRGGRVRSDALVRGYRALAGAAVRHGLGSGGVLDRGDFDALDPPDLDRLLATVAAANRKSGLSISDLLDDLRYLTPATVTWARGRSGSSEATPELLRMTTRVVLTLDLVARRIVRVLEASAARARREQAEALSAMTDMVSHELRNRLGAARTASQMIASPHLQLDEAGLRRAAELVQASVEAALGTVEDVRALAASSSSLAHDRLRTISLPVLLRAIVEEQRGAALDAGVEIDSSGPIVDCRVDAARLRLIVSNLVNNGIKYRDETAEHPYVRVECEPTADGVVSLRVSDNGIGIPAGEIDGVFQYRVRGSAADDVPGSGLGLAIVKEAVEQMDAELSVESEPGVGTIFTLLFTPIVDEGSPETGPAVGAPS